MSLPEVIFWQAVRKRRTGIKFRRQHPFGPYILDFYCLELKLAVEIDGAGHGHPEQLSHDARRDAYLASRGLRVMRFPAVTVLKDVGSVLDAIESEILPRPKGP